MNDGDLKYCMRDISDDLVKEADMFAPGAPELTNTSGAGGTAAGTRKSRLGGVIAAAVLAVALLGTVIYLFIDSRKRTIDPPETTNYISELPTPSETPVRPTYTATPTTKPTAAPTAEVTETPTPTAEPTPEPTAEPTAEITATPAPTAEPLPDYMTDYSAWVRYREADPEAYEAWKNAAIPEKPAEEKLPEEEGEYIYESGIGSRYAYKYRYLPDAFVKAFGYREPISSRYNSSDLRTLEYDQTSMPGVLTEIIRYGVSKAELQEYCRWQDYSPQFSCRLYSSEEIELLYSGDKDRIRAEFKMEGSIVCGDRIITSRERGYIDDYDYGRLFESEEDAVNYIISQSPYYAYPSNAELLESFKERYRRAREEYLRIKEADSGPLSKETAAGALEIFFDIYDGLRYSPEKWTGGYGAPHFDYLPSTRAYWELTINGIHIYYVPEQLYKVLPAQYVWAVGSDKRFGLFEDSGDNGPAGQAPWAINIDPVYYDGPVRPFSSDYTLYDHISVDNTGDGTAVVNITCIARDGKTKLKYKAEFSRVDGRWRITGGNVLDLIISPPSGLTIRETAQKLVREYDEQYPPEARGLKILPDRTYDYITIYPGNSDNEVIASVTYLSAEYGYDERKSVPIKYTLRYEVNGKSVSPYSGTGKWTIVNEDWSEIWLTYKASTLYSPDSAQSLRSYVQRYIVSLSVKALSLIGYDVFNGQGLRYEGVPVGGRKTVDNSEGSFLIMPPGLDSPEKWREYLKGFCTGDVAAELMSGPQAGVFDGKLYIRGEKDANGAFVFSDSCSALYKEFIALLRDDPLTYTIEVNKTENTFTATVDLSGINESLGGQLPCNSMTFVYSYVDGWVVSGGNFIEVLEAIRTYGGAGDAG
ncbi:MAG: hypothetical protein J5584_07970 [Clostridia bacterium]|nr:hypothetical protein [Clostridia bacterium]